MWDSGKRKLECGAASAPSKTAAFAASATLATLLSSSIAARADEPQRSSSTGREAAGFVSRASIEDSPREITDAASLIEPMPGVHVRRLGADDSFATLSVRGTSSTQVAIYLAGVPLSGGADPTLDLATLPLWPGARARVYRSFAPAALGRGSLGGTLVLDTPSARAPNGTEVYAAVGAYGSRRIRASDVSGDPDGVRIATGFSASRSDDDFSFIDTSASIAAGHEVLATRENAGHAAASGMASIAVPVTLGPGNVGALTVTTLAQTRRQHLPGTIQVPSRFERLDSNRLLGALELTLPAGPGAAIARTWARREGLMIHGDPEESARLGGSPSATDDAIVAAGGNIGWRGRPSTSTTLDARLDASGERFAPGTWVGGFQPAGATRTNVGAGVDATLQPIDPLTLAASARADAWFDGSADSGSKSATRPTGNVGAEIVLGPVTLATHGGVLARPPSFVERFGDHGIFIGEPDLKPESATTIDAGGSFTTRLGGVVRMHLELAGFATWAEDLIVFHPRRRLRPHASAEHRPGRGCSARRQSCAPRRTGSSCDSPTPRSPPRTRAGAASSPEPCERPSLPGRPEQDFVGDLSYGIGPVRLRYGIDVVAGIQADDIGDFHVPNRVLHSAGARLAVPGLTGPHALARRAQPLRPPRRRLSERAGRDRPLPDRRSLRLSHPWSPPPSQRSVGLSGAENEC